MERIEISEQVSKHDLDIVRIHESSKKEGGEIGFLLKQYPCDMIAAIEYTTFDRLIPG